jgi:hypothetical protein
VRTYNELVTDAIKAIPLPEEMARLTDAQIQDLRKLGNTYDNQLYMAWLRRNDQKIST